MPRCAAKTPWMVAGWLLLCAFLNCAGWILSALHQLNRAGYAVSFLVVAGVLFLAWRRGGLPELLGWRMNRLRRFSRAYPAAFLFLAGLVFLGGALHPPSNYDGLAYREPRVLHWLAEGGWHWIHTGYQRLNVRACGFEWLCAPLFLFTRTDRLVFLINIVSFLMLPGLIFSVFTGLGIRARTAWHWMWLLPSGYCFLLQAGSIGNDAFSSVYALAALAFAFRARETGRMSDFWLSSLAAALLTSTKSTNLVCLLPWGIAMLPSWRLILARPITTAAVAVVAVGSSFLPVAYLNWSHCRDWTGQAAEQGVVSSEYPMLHLTQNAALLTFQNLVPPVFPPAKQWEDYWRRTLSQERVQRLEQIFETGARYFTVPELQNEETAGLGFGVSMLVLVTFAATWWSKPGGNPPMRLRRSSSDTLRHAEPGSPGGTPGSTAGGTPAATWWRAAILAGAWVSLVPLMLVSGSTTPARYLGAFYVTLVPVFLLRQSGDWILRHRWWRVAGLVVFAIAAVLVVISPARPLWPARNVLGRVDDNSSRWMQRAKMVYAVYGERSDAFAPVRARLPAEAQVLGFVGFDDPETSLWRPFGTRRIRHVLPGESGETLRSSGMRYVLVRAEWFKQHFGESLDQWLGGINAELVETMPLNLRASRGPQDWYLVKLKK